LFLTQVIRWILILLIRIFVNLMLTKTTISSRSTGPKCIHSHILLRAFAGEVFSQVVVVIVERPSTLRTERTIVAQTGRHQLNNR